MEELPKFIKDADVLELHALFPKHTDETFNLVSLDGFFHGLGSLPKMLPPSTWMDAVLPVSALQNQARLKRAFELLFRYQAKVTLGLLEKTPDLYCDGSREQVEQWLEGFTFAFGYDREALNQLAEEELKSGENSIVYAAIIAGFILGSEDKTDSEELKKVAQVKADALKVHTEKSPNENLETLYDFLMTVHELLEPAREKINKELKTITRSEPKVGRNDPCPCGSGRKYKHCHGKN
jgi:yecA family protein